MQQKFDNIPLQESEVLVMAGKSVVKFTPKTEMDFGSLVCWGSNQVGLGSPCVFHLLPIGPPEPPSDCYTHNITYSTVQVLPRSYRSVQFLCGNCTAKSGVLHTRDMQYADIPSLMTRQGEINHLCVCRCPAPSHTTTRGRRLWGSSR